MTKLFDVVIVVYPTAEDAAKGIPETVITHTVTGSDQNDAVKKVLVKNRATLPDDPNRIEVHVRPFN